MKLTVQLLHVCNDKNTYKVLFVNIRAKRNNSTLVIVGTFPSSMTWTHFKDHLTQEEKERSEFLGFLNFILFYEN